jgi:hypothetical protein
LKKCLHCTCAFELSKRRLHGPLHRDEILFFSVAFIKFVILNLWINQLLKINFIPQNFIQTSWPLFSLLCSMSLLSSHDDTSSWKLIWRKIFFFFIFSHFRCLQSRVWAWKKKTFSWVPKLTFFIIFHRATRQIGSDYKGRWWLCCMLFMLQWENLWRNNCFTSKVFLNLMIAWFYFIIITTIIYYFKLSASLKNIIAFAGWIIVLKAVN